MFSGLEEEIRGDKERGISEFSTGEAKSEGGQFSKVRIVMFWELVGEDPCF